MRLNRKTDCTNGQGAIEEGDPLPPEDRVVSPPPDWLELLYRGYKDRLIRFARGHIASDKAPDVVQQLFAKLATLDETFTQSVANPGAYLRTATRNLILNEYRLGKRRSEHLHVCCDSTEIGGPDPVGALEAKDTLRRLEAIMARLKPITREIFLAHRLDGYTYAEIAARTGLSVKTVEKHMSRAIAFVARHLEP